MPNSRKDSKKHRGAWLEPAVIDRLREIAVAFVTGRKEWKFRVVTVKANEGDREGNRSRVVYDNAAVLTPTHAAMRPGGILNVGNAAK